MKLAKKKPMIPLFMMVSVPSKSYASINIEQDSITTLQNYLPSASTIEIIERFSAGLGGAKSGRMLSVTGPYGSGKSTMATFLNGLFAGTDSKEWKIAHKILRKESHDTYKLFVKARKKSNSYKKGLIRCVTTARREPITVTILHALDDGAKKYFGRYSKRHFPTAERLKKIMRELPDKTPSVQDILDIISDMCRVVPVVIMIDEFGKNIEYFTIDETQQSDLYLLQELAELSGPGRQIPLSIITLQHMAFEEYAVGASMAHKQEWAKIQGRFEDIPFANSPDQTRLLVSNTIKLEKVIKLAKGIKPRKIITDWAKKEARLLRHLGIESGFDYNLVATCYPLGPLALEVLPELCSRYGQHERTLLSFISDSGKHTVATFIDENFYDGKTLPTMGLDILYDHFISGTSMVHSSSSNITRLMEIETIIRDSHGLDDLEIKALKTIGILNLIGRSGYLRASRGIIDYALGGKSRPVLEKLLTKSIITYRNYADEYRIWHGTDIDIAVKLDIYRKRYRKSSLSVILSDVLNLEPIVAAKHSIDTGTMRLFDRQFASESHIKLAEGYDGVILYKTDNSEIPTCDKPVIIVTARDTAYLHSAAVEVMAIRDILDSEEDVSSDWVARKELEERLADAEIKLDRQFGMTYGDAALWVYDGVRLKGTPSAMASAVCNKAYSKTPQIHNEMINKTILSTQGSGAKRKLIERMIAHVNQPRFGIEGYGPERAVYEAIFIKNDIHISAVGGPSYLDAPSQSSSILPVWDKIYHKIKNSKTRISLSEIYAMCKMPPYGMKDGVIVIFIITIFLLYRNYIALYEHGTYAPYLTIEIAERMIKNPNHFELKHFKSTPSKKALLAAVIKEFEIKSEGSVLDVVSHLVRIASALAPYTKQTKNMEKNSTAVRDAVLTAVEPDTLLFEALPKALGYKINSKSLDREISGFVRDLVDAKTTMQNYYLDMIRNIRDMIFEYTGIENREKLSNTAKTMLHNVTDQKMKVFLTALSSDTIDREEDWINYVSLSLTDLPPMSWKDDQYDLFKNNLIETSRKFKRLASVQFSNISDNFTKPSYQITVTHADGSEHHNVVSLKPTQKKKLESIVDEIIRNMKKQKFTNNDIGALVAMLSSKST